VSDEINVLNFLEINNKDLCEVADMILQRLPTPAIIFKLNDAEILKLEPGKFTSCGETLPDLKSVYDRLVEWLMKVESFGKEKDLSGKEKETYIEELEAKLKRAAETPNY
jgi:hypothetical protein